MKNLIIFGLFILVLVCAQFAQAQTVEEVISKHVDALGGKENLNKIQNVLMEGSLTYQGIEVAMTFTQVNNKLNRQDINANGMHGFDLLTDKDGWSYMPFFGMSAPEPKPAEEVKANQADLEINGPLVDYVVKGHKAALMGKEKVEAKDCYKIKITLASGKIVYQFIDAETYLINRTIDKTMVNGKETDQQTDFADYKTVDGVKMPYSITGQVGTINISTIKFNQSISESAYKHDM